MTTGEQLLVEHRAIGVICDREALAVWANRSVETIRKRCPVQERDRRGRPLYVADQCLPILAELDHRRDREGGPVTEEGRPA